MKQLLIQCYNKEGGVPPFFMEKGKIFSYLSLLIKLVLYESDKV